MADNLALTSSSACLVALLKNHVTWRYRRYAPAYDRYLEYTCVLRRYGDPYHTVVCVAYLEVK